MTVQTVKIITVEDQTDTSILLTCQVEDSIRTLNMPKLLATKIWKTTTTSDILKKLEDQQMFSLVLQSTNIIKLNEKKPEAKVAAASKPSTRNLPK